MDADEIRRYSHSVPFKAFGLRLKDGSLVEVLEPLRLAILPDNKTLDVAFPTGGGVRFSLDEVAKIEPLGGRGGRSARGRRRAS
jgi:hypothetical protein